jgi:asparagine synthase (glutamine-hydrolysing)
MCGLVGIYSRRGAPVDQEVLARATGLLHRRGPDGSGLWAQGAVGLGHRRLAVIELSEAGAQPMVSAGGTCAISYNGEVYNFRQLREELSTSGTRWRGHSDTEVILSAYERWGVDFVGRLQGMFAIAIWDGLRQSLLLARDRLGVKPLFYSLTPERVVFGSRPRALVALDPGLSANLSRSALKMYVESGYVGGPHCIYARIAKLPPGHALVVSGDSHRIHRYWSPDDHLPDAALEKASEEELLGELDRLTDEAVRARLVSDVPLGAFLSGGLDSGVVVAKMAKASSAPVHAFTIGFHESEHDESEAAARIARHLGVHHVVERLGADDLLSLVDLYLEEFDEPFSDSSAFPTMAVSRLARRSVTVALTGDGGDELFAGYHYYGLLRRLQPAFRFPKALRGIAGAASGALLGHRGKLLAGALQRQSPASAFTYMRSIRKDFGEVFDWAEWSDALGYEESAAVRLEQMPASLDPVTACARLDLATILPDDYLQKVDLSSMAFSLEAREPLLDYRLVEWSLRLPTSWKLRGGAGKYLWRRLAARYLPPEIIQGPKRGFTVPIDRWLRGPLCEWFMDLISEPLLYETLPLRREALDALVREHMSGRRNAYPLLWALALLSNFLRRTSRTRTVEA